MLRGDVLGLADVFCQVIQADGRVWILGHLQANGLPVAHANGLRLAIGMEFPVEILVRPLCATGQRWHVGDAVSMLGGVNAGEITEGGHQVPVRTDVVAHGAGFHLAGPMGNERHANASLIQVALVAFQGAIAVKETGLMAAFIMGSVVAGKEHERVVGDLEFIE